MDQVNTPESWWVTVSNPDSGTFKLNLLNPTTTPASYWQSAPISASASSNEFRSAINGYYRKFFSMEVAVQKQMFDVSSAITTNAQEAVTTVFTVTLLK